MTHHSFTSAFGVDAQKVADTILKVHDDAPNADKRAWRLLHKAVESAAGNDGYSDVGPLAGALRDAARKQLNGLVRDVQETCGALTFELAAEAIAKSDVGTALQAIIKMSERAEVATSQQMQRVEKSLAQKDEERLVFDRAKELQVEKASEGQPVSLLEALELAREAG